MRAFEVRNDRAIALAELERFDEAAAEVQRARTTGRRAKNRAMELQASMNLGEIRRRMGHLDEAVAELQEAARLARSIGDRRAEANVLLLLGLTSQDRGMSDEAAEKYRAADDLGRQLGDKDVQAAALGGFAGLDFAAGRFRRAASRYRRAVALANETTRQVVEDAAGYLRSVSAAGIDEDIQNATQQLVDLAQEVGAEADAAISICDGAHWWLERGDVATATDLYVADDRSRPRRRRIA